jgi:hypothetical protein
MYNRSGERKVASDPAKEHGKRYARADSLW